MSFKNIAITIGSLLLLTACVTPPKPIPFDAASGPKVKTIGLLTSAMPERAEANLATSVGQSFGLIGALVDASLKANRDDKFNALLQSQNFDAQTQWTQTLKADLEAEGFQVVLVPIMREDKSDFLKSYFVPMSSPAPDALLDTVTLTYGYIAAGIKGSTPYRPYMYTKVKLVDPKDASTLMQDEVIYNPLSGGAALSNVTIAPDPAYSYSDFDLLVANPAETRKGVDDSFAKSAQAIAQLLK